MEEEWAKPDKRFNRHNKSAKMYLFGTKDAALWDTLPMVDLPLGDSVSFKDRKIDTDLKKIYLVTGVACRPAIALTSVAANIKVWVSDLGPQGSGEIRRGRTSSPLCFIKMVVYFFGGGSSGLGQNDNKADCPLCNGSKCLMAEALGSR